MALKKFSIGDKGPYFYDDSVDLVPSAEADTSDSPTDPWSDDTPVVGNEYMPADPIKQRAFRTQAPMWQEEVPSGTIPQETVNVAYITGAVQFVVVTSVDAPDLSSYVGAAVGALLIASQANANANEYTIYAWDNADALGVNSPYVLAGSSGFWIAIAGKYINGSQTLNAELSVPTINKYIYVRTATSTAIQVAHDALPATGGTIILNPQTTYDITTITTISKPNVTILGGGFSTILKRNASFITGANIQLRVAVTATKCRFDSFTIDGNGAAAIATNPELQILADSCTMNNIWVKDARIQGVTPFTHTKILNCIFNGLNDNAVNNFGVVKTTPQEGIIIDNCEFYNYTLGAVELDIVNGKISNCFFSNNNGAGGQLALSSSRNTIISNCCFAAGRGTGGSAMELNGDVISVVDCTIESQPLWGIVLQAGSGYLIAGCLVKSCGVSAASAGIRVVSGVSDFTIIGNRSVLNSNYGIDVATGGSDNYIIACNYLVGNTTAGLNDGGTGTNKHIFGNLPSTIVNVFGNATVWTSANDGSGSDLDADLLDGHDSTYFSVAGTTMPPDPIVPVDGTQNITGALAVSGAISGSNLSGTNTGDQTLPVGANPAASIGLTAVNGSAGSFLRSDGAPPLDVTIAPTWTGVHTFSPTTSNNNILRILNATNTAIARLREIGTSALASLQLTVNWDNVVAAADSAAQGSAQIALVTRNSDTTNSIQLGTGTIAAPTPVTHLCIQGTGRTGIGITGTTITAPTAGLHLAAGTTAASTAPEKFTSGTLMTTAEAGACEYNGNHYKTNAFIRFPLGGTLFDHFVDANGGTSETDMYSDTLAASTLAVDGDKVQAHYCGTMVFGALTSQRVRAYFGGAGIFDTGAVTLAANTDWQVDVTIIRVSSSVVRCMVSLQTTSTTTFTYEKYTEVTSLTLSNTQILKITGVSTGTGSLATDVIAKLGTVEFKPAA